MPYIKEERRKALFNDSIVDRDDQIRTAGELNYFISYLIDEYIRNQGLSYQSCNDIVGALENAKDEFQRRIQHPYEDLKIKENGDVYHNTITKLGEIYGRRSSSKSKKTRSTGKSIRPNKQTV